MPACWLLKLYSESCFSLFIVLLAYLSIWIFNLWLVCWNISPKWVEEDLYLFSSVQFSRSVVSNSLWLHALQHTRRLCPSPTPGVYSNSCPLSRRCYPTIHPLPPPSPSQFSSVAQSCLTLCDPMDCSTPGFSVHHQLLEFTQTHVHRLVVPSSHIFDLKMVE